MTIEVNALHLQKALFPNVSTVSGITMDFNVMHFSKALFPMLLR